MIAERAERTDADLIRDVLAGSPATFELLVRRHNQRLYRAVRVEELQAGFRTDGRE